MREPSASDYNLESRTIEFKLDIYFDGLSRTPVTITKEDYLMNLDLLEEACADTTSFIGTPSANELSFDLFSQDGLFNPANRLSPYYRKIKLGLPIFVYCRPVLDEEISWDKLGEFFVSDWTTDITGITASVVAEDSLYSLLNGDMVFVPIKENYLMIHLLQDFFAAVQKPLIVKGIFDQYLKYSFIHKDNASFLKEFAIGALAFIYNNHQGNTVVQAVDNITAVDWELTDNDQIISIKASQSILTSYDGVALTGLFPQVSTEKSVLQLREQEIEAEQTLQVDNLGFSATPLYALSHVEFESEADCEVTEVQATEVAISYKLKNLSSIDATVKLNFFGYILEQIANTFSDNTDDMLKVSNEYIQTEPYAKHIKTLLNAYIQLPIPVLELTIRGNPKYQPGDKVRIYSEKYNIDFTGLLIRQQFKYSGGLQCTIKVLNSSIIGGS